jgi:Na+/H+-dicarboxylate symporter
MVLESVGIDPTYIGLIYGIDRLFDMGRTTMNIVGDASCAVCVNHWESKEKQSA